MTSVRTLSRSLGMLTVLALVFTAAPAHAAYYQLRYRGEMLGAAVVDSSGLANDGTVLSANGGAITALIDPDGRAVLRFPAGTCLASPCAQAMIRPATSADLHGGAGTFAFGATIRLTAVAITGMNVFQRGFFGAAQWKLQADSGRPSCRWSDGVQAVLLPDGADPRFDLPIGQWVKVKCSRLAGNVFELRITDPDTGVLLSPLVRRTVPLGSINPTGTASIGAKSINAAKDDSQTDQFRGDLSHVFFHRD